jgi:hypothetical protein
MGTKNNPGKYDCYAKADPDEPLFTLRGKDVSAPYLVEIWTAVRQGRYRPAMEALAAMFRDPRVIALTGGECEKFDEALACAGAMREWRKKLDAESQ